MNFYVNVDFLKHCIKYYLFLKGFMSQAFHSSPYWKNYYLLSINNPPDPALEKVT